MPSPLPQAHAHNDYEHPRPLFDALEHGFTSIEADIFLVDGELLVAHDLEDVRPDRTLDALYLAPLAELVRQHDGAVYPDGSPVILLIDIKSAAVSTYYALRPLLEQYKHMLTEYRDGTVTERAVTAIISGNRPVRIMAEERLRYASVDGRLGDLETNPPVHLVPLISDHWPGHFEWRGSGPIPEDEFAKLRDIVQTAHAQGRKVRFWATRERPEKWDVLLEAGVDLIGTDYLGRLAEYLREREKNAP